MIVLVGILSALLVIPQVRAVAGGILASSAVLGARGRLRRQLDARELRRRAPDRVHAAAAARRPSSIDGKAGIVEEIGLTYTFIRTHDNDRLVIPNEKLASDTIRNSTIVSREKLAEVTVQVPLDTDLAAVVAALRDAAGDDPGAEVLVTALTGNATVTLRVWAADASRPTQRSRATCGCASTSGCARPGCSRDASGRTSATATAGARADVPSGVAAPAAPARAREGAAGAAAIVARHPRACSSCSRGGRGAGFGGAAAFRASCTLSSLRPVAIGQNSFVYAGDGIAARLDPGRAEPPAGRAARRQPWLPKATVAIEDRRFYQHGGVDWEGIARAALEGPQGRQGRPGRLDDHAAARPQPLHRRRERTLERKVKEACLAIKLVARTGRSAGSSTRT